MQSINSPRASFDVLPERGTSKSLHLCLQKQQLQGLKQTQEIDLRRQLRGRNNVITHRSTQRAKLNTLLIDNYDSYTYNLFQLISVVNGVAPVVIKNDEYSWREISNRLSNGTFDDVVISPGPGTPHRHTDIGICRHLLEEAEDVPVLAVCLGMQALALVHGGEVHRAPEPVHGRLSGIEHNGHALFKNVPSGAGNGFDVVRYHSLAVDGASLPSCLQAIAWTCGRHHAVSPQQSAQVMDPMESRMQEGMEGRVENPSSRVLMGIAHKSRKHLGVQFHPESVATQYGVRLLRNFRELSLEHREARDRSQIRHELPPQSNGVMSARPLLDTAHSQSAPTLDVRWKVEEGALSHLGGSEALFWGLFGRGDATDTFWLDSASEGQRFSYMGGRGGPLWQRVTFKLAHPATAETSTSGSTCKQQIDNPLQPGTVVLRDSAGQERSFQSHFLDFLEEQLRVWKCDPDGAAACLPFDFTGGFVGYLGYEMKAECGAPGLHSSPHPDAAMFLIDRLLAIDHVNNDIYIVAMHQRGIAAEANAAEDWIKSTSSRLNDLKDQCRTPHSYSHTAAGQAGHADIMPSEGNAVSENAADGSAVWEESITEDGSQEARRSRTGYTKDVASCLEALKSGESYELCLTTQLRHKARVSAKHLYSELRASNPSAHAAWLKFSEAQPTICCSSPERFLRGTHGGVVEARPIKGTVARSDNPSEDELAKQALALCEKSRAENLMIVDLLRNDLGKFCQAGSVHVSKLMEVESYTTVHNLVSTVRGIRQEGTSAIDCIRAAFPGGSMTGAPKLRSMQILDRLERGPRGVYSGSLGFIGFNDTFDLNIVIRTAVVSDYDVTIGAGGAIVLQSHPEGEYEEMRLKARALLQAVTRCCTEVENHKLSS